MNSLLKIFLIIFFLGNLSCSLGKPELPVLGTLPDFSLQDQEGKAFAREDLNGKVWATNFIFTSCAGTCPLLTKRMTHVQDSIITGSLNKFGKQIGILSISVDPERDSPKVLKKYAANHGVRIPDWKFLTGGMREIEKTVVSGFKMAMGKVPAEGKQAGSPGDFYDIVHGEKFILIDRKGQIRGYYDANEKGIGELIVDMKFLVKRGNS